MKKKLAILFIIGISISILVSCFPTEYFLIKDFKLYGVELKNPNEMKDENKEFRNVSDTLRNKLFFRVFGVSEWEYTASLKNISLISQCYATSRPKKLDNRILFEELELRLNSDIYFESELIEKGTDLWNHSKLKSYRWFYEYKKYDEDVWFSTIIGFIDSFYDKVVVPPKDYTIEITCKTSDNRVITKSIELYLKI
jgi:hypothetical protein